MNVETRKVNRVGTSLAVYLSKYMKKLGIDQGDYVNIYTDEDKIIICPNNSSDPIKPIKFDEQLWKEFVSVITKIHGRTYAKSDENIAKCLEEAVRMWIKKKDSFLERPIIRI